METYYFDESMKCTPREELMCLHKVTVGSPKKEPEIFEKAYKCRGCGRACSTGPRKLCKVCWERSRIAATGKYARDCESRRKRIAARRAAGLCGDCGRVPPLEGRKRCLRCLEKHRR